MGTRTGTIPPASAVRSIKKLDEEQRLVFGEVYAPGFPDSQGDFMTRETIQKMAYEFLRKGLIDSIDIQHSQEKCGAYVVESFIARDNDDTFIPGSWVLGVHIPDDETWGLVKSGELNGFSLDGRGVRVQTELVYEIPEMIWGGTEKSEGHDHTFHVRYSPSGEFLGGKTDPAPDGHFHTISAGTVTDVTNGHSHRFSYIEGVLQCA